MFIIPFSLSSWLVILIHTNTCKTHHKGESQFLAPALQYVKKKKFTFIMRVKITCHSVVVVLVLQISYQALPSLFLSYT